MCSVKHASGLGTQRAWKTVVSDDRTRACWGNLIGWEEAKRMERPQEDNRKLRQLLMTLKNASRTMATALLEME